MYALSTEFENLVRNRIRGCLPEQKHVYASIKNGRPLDGEDDAERKIAYVKRKVGVSSRMAKEIADYKDVARLNLPDNKKTKAESIQGPTVDFMSICFVDLARAASHAVARVVFLDGKPQGTGFMISPSLFLTNQHVIRDAEDASGFELEFNYEQDFRLNALTKTKYRLDPNTFFLSSPETDLDFSLVAIGQKVQGPLDAAAIGFLPLFDSDDKHAKSIFVNCIEHPNGNYKQLVIRENRLTARTDNTLIYSSDTLPGASGSPIFNDDWKVLALHHYGEPYRAISDPHENKGLPSIGNEGIRVSSIVRYLTTKANDLDASRSTLLKKALSYNFRQPSIIVNDKKESLAVEAKQTNKTSLHETNNISHNQPIVMPTNTNNAVSFTVPLTITLQLGTMAASNPTSSVESDATKAEQNDSKAESLVPDSDYSNRKGYDKNFLGISLELPTLSAAKSKQAAKNKMNESYEFKYQHFSVVMNGERKVAYFRL